MRIPEHPPRAALAGAGNRAEVVTGRAGNLTLSRYETGQAVHGGKRNQQFSAAERDYERRQPEDTPGRTVIEVIAELLTARKRDRACPRYRKGVPNMAANEREPAVTSSAV